MDSFHWRISQTGLKSKLPSDYTQSLTHLKNSHISTYLSAFFSLPVKTSTGQQLTHEEVVNRLDDETVSYEVGLGIANSFAETLRVSIKVETAAYEKAIAWIRDLVYGSEFTKERLVTSVLSVTSQMHIFSTGYRSLLLKYNNPCLR